MKNLTNAKNATLEATAHLLRGDRQAALSAIKAIQMELAKLDGQWMAEMLAAQPESLPMRPGSLNDRHRQNDYTTGRVLHQLGAEATWHSMKAVYEATKPHKDLLLAKRRYDKDLATGYALLGEPPLKAISGKICKLDERKLIARYTNDTLPPKMRTHTPEQAIPSVAPNPDHESQQNFATTSR
jgi:hypothetical protein